MGEWTTTEITACIVGLFIILVIFPSIYFLFGKEYQCGDTNWKRIVRWFKNTF